MKVDYIAASARLSPCGEYRYLLTRSWSGHSRSLVWVMLNPSTADADKDDSTIRRVVDFSRRNGYGSAAILNLFALRSTDKSQLMVVDDPIGPLNDDIIREYTKSQVVVCAWGTEFNEMVAGRAKDVRRVLGDAAAVTGLGFTKDGSPRHPLYMPRESPLLPWKEAPDES